MSTNSYAAGVLPSNDPAVIKRCLVAVPYTNVHMGHDQDGTIHCHVDETVTYAAMKTAIEAEHPPASDSLSASASSITCVGNGSATTPLTISDSRGAGASGKTCKVRLLTGGGLVKITPSVNFDGSGDAIFTLGATPAADMCSLPFKVEFYVDTEPEVTPVEVICQFTPG